jgi:plasmid stabilization system protein ParE
MLSLAAEGDIDRLWAYLVEVDPGAAPRAVETLRSALASLDMKPERGRPSPVEGFRELAIPLGRKVYVARYRVDARTLLITRIHHSNEDRR